MGWPWVSLEIDEVFSKEVARPDERDSRETGADYLKEAMALASSS